METEAPVREYGLPEIDLPRRGMNRRCIPQVSAQNHVSRQGFTLLELMIASVISIIVSAMMFSVLTEQERSSTRLNTNADMQDDLRAAMNVLSRQVRSAGYGVGPQVIGSSLNTMYTLRTCTGCGGYSFDGTSDTAVGTDQLFIAYRNPRQEFFMDRSWFQLSQPKCNERNLQAGPAVAVVPDTDNPVVIERNEVILCSDESAPAIVRYLGFTMAAPPVFSIVRNGNTGGGFSVAANSVAPYTTACKSTETLPMRMTCGGTRGSLVGFYVDRQTLWMFDNPTGTFNSVTSGPTTAFLTPSVDDIPLATGIEDFQVAVCVPGGASANTMSAVDRAAAIRDCLDNPASVHWMGRTSGSPYVESLAPYAAAVRVTLVAIGRIDPSGKSFVSNRPAAEDHAPSEVAQSSSQNGSTRYPRQVQTMVIPLPNLISAYDFKWKGL